MARPRTRTGNEIQIAVQLEPEEYAQFAGYVEVLKEKVRQENGRVSEVSGREVMRSLWTAHWKSLSPALKRAVRARPEFKDNPKIAAAKKSQRLKRARTKRR